ncbi:hypothetical protein AAK899_05895 [Erysipelotrichaceae bacterium 51-3]
MKPITEIVSYWLKVCPLFIGINFSFCPDPLFCSKFSPGSSGFFASDSASVDFRIKKGETDVSVGFAIVRINKKTPDISI